MQQWGDRHVGGRTSIAARASVKVGRAGAVAGADSWGNKGEMGTADSMEGSGAKGMGNGGNKAARGACAWASLCCGYTLHMAALNSSQVFGSGKESRIVDHISHVGPSV